MRKKGAAALLLTAAVFALSLFPMFADDASGSAPAAEEVTSQTTENAPESDLTSAVADAPAVLSAGASEENPILVPDDALVIEGGKLYGISKAWFTQNNPEQGTLYVTVSVPAGVVRLEDNCLNMMWSSDKNRYGAVNNNDGVGSFAVVGLDFSRASDLTSIGSQAVLSASSLTGVVDLSKTKITEIGKSAFRDCPKLTGVILPDTLTTLGDPVGGSGSVFNGCSGMQYIRLASSSSDTLLELPESLTFIGNQTFRSCFAAGLDIRVVIPESVETIGSEAFYSDRISQIIVKRQGDGWDSRYTGYNSSAFKTGNSKLLVVFNDNTSYQDYKLNCSPSSAVRNAMSYPITLTFGNTGIQQEKLNYQSIAYTRVEGTEFWQIDASYSLPSLEGTPEEKPGYDATWMLSGKALTATSKIDTNQTEPKATVSYSLQNPQIGYSVDGVVQNGSELSVKLDGFSTHTAGVSVSHPLLLSEQGTQDEYVYFQYCWWDESGEGINGPRSQEEPELFSHEESGKLQRVKTENAEIPILSADHARTDGSQYMVEIYGYIVKDGGEPQLFYKSHYNFIDFVTDNDTEATVSDSYVFTVNVEVAESVSVTPVDVVIYSGGAGYEGTAGENGSLSGTMESGFPEPGFAIELPADLNAQLRAQLGVGEDEVVDLSPYVSFVSGDKEWSLELYGGVSMADGRYVYRLVAKEGQDPVRVQFTDETGTVHINDQFELSKVLYSKYQMQIYPGAVDQNTVAAVISVGGTTEYRAVDSQAGELTIRGVTQQGGTTAVQTPESLSGPVRGITAVLPGDTKYYVNDGSVLVVDGTPALLVDDIVHTQESDALLKSKALSALSMTESSDLRFDFRYLDLVDTANGNTWIRADKTTAIYWPYPAGTDQNTEFRLVHYEGLDRDMTVADLTDRVDSCSAQEIRVEKTEYGIRFETESFSPFVLVWEQPEAASGGSSVSGSVQTGDASAPAALAALLVVSAASSAWIVRGRKRRG